MSYSKFTGEVGDIARAPAEMVTVAADVIGITCPQDNAPLWQMHPRIFLRFGPHSDVSCPYCGCRYHREAH